VDLALDANRTVRITGKGRKQPVVPLWQGTARRLREWMARIGPAPEGPLFPNCDGRPMSRSGVEKRLQKAVLRHTTAMHLLQSGVDITVIALRLGHESLETTHQYVEANLAMKDAALSKPEEVPTPKVRYRASDKLLQFLDNL
jgi:integrase/recombinase XerD